MDHTVEVSEKNQDQNEDTQLLLGREKVSDKMRKKARLPAPLIHISLVNMFFFIYEIKIVI